MHGRFLVAATHKPVLFAFIDDHSRLIVGWKWTLAEDTLRAGNALREGLTRRGVPTGCYLDNGSPFVSAQFGRALAKMGIRLWHSKPGEPAGGEDRTVLHGRSVNDHVRSRLLTGGVETMAELERLFAGWVEQHYHRQVPFRNRSRPRSTRHDAAAGKTSLVLKAPTPRCGLLERRSCRSRRPYSSPKPRPMSLLTPTVTKSKQRWLAGTSSWSSTRSTLTRIDVFYEDRTRRHRNPTSHYPAHPFRAEPPDREPEPDRHHHAPSGIDYLGMLADHTDDQLHQQIFGEPSIDYQALVETTDPDLAVVVGGPHPDFSRYL